MTATAQTLGGAPNLRDYAIITGTYWVFTLSDGALRMLVLLHLHQTGHSPFEIASLFLFYEFFGVLTNLFGGWIGARQGLKLTLASGVALQVAACSLLAWSAPALSVPLVMLAQAMSGTAKDLTKMSSKSYVKLVAPRGDEGGLMRWVAVLTGSKNTLKGVGFFLGGALLSEFGFRDTCWAMAAVLAGALVLSSCMLPRAAGRSSSKAKLGQLISKDPRVNWLSGSRFFLFGARDIWFVLALPIFLSSALDWGHAQVSAFLALWVIGYGIVQALAPNFVGAVKATEKRGAPTSAHLTRWTAGLLIPLLAICASLSLGGPARETLIVGLLVFGFVFAATSAIHSYLIVSYSDDDKVSLNVGFYYMANAAGRLAGTVLSGSLFQMAGQGAQGLLVCLLASSSFVVLSTLLCLPLARRKVPVQA